MLKKIVFLLADESQKAVIEKMKANMGTEGEKIFCLIGDCRVLQNNGKNEDTEKETLFVADSAAVLEELMGRGDSAIAFLHENNGRENLSGAAYAITDIESLEWESLEKAYLRLMGQPWMIMETKRCVIRETAVEDVEEFYGIYAEPSITRYMENLFPDPADEIEYTKNYIREIYGFYGYGLWTVVCREKGRIIGRAGLSWRQGFDIPELGFVIAVPYQGKGYAYEVCSAIVEYGEQQLGFREIQALVQKENKASANLCMKLGFVRKDKVEDRGVWYERYIKIR